VIDFYRARHDDVQLDEAHAVDDSPHESVARADEFAAVRRGLGKLGERDREIIHLAYFDELSGEEIAAILNCSANSAYVRLHRALKKLEKELGDEIN